SCPLSRLMPYCSKPGPVVEWKIAAPLWCAACSISEERGVLHMAIETSGSGNAAKKDPIAMDGSGAVDAAQMTQQERAEAATKLVERFSLWSGVAGLIPLPIVDVAVVAGLQLQLLRRLSKLYGVAFSDNLGKSIIASLMGSMIPASSGMGVASAL